MLYYGYSLCSQFVNVSMCGCVILMLLLSLFYVFYCNLFSPLVGGVNKLKKKKKPFRPVPSGGRGGGSRGSDDQGTYFWLCMTFDLGTVLTKKNTCLSF